MTQRVRLTHTDHSLKLLLIIPKTIKIQFYLRRVGLKMRRSRERENSHVKQQMTSSTRHVWIEERVLQQEHGGSLTSSFIMM